MDRKKILDARIRLDEVTPFCFTLLTFTFHADRDVRHAGGPVTARRFRITFNRALRQFKGEGTRRISKRRKREMVTLSKGMVDYLRTRLPPEAVAACTMAAMVERDRPKDAVIPTYALHGVQVIFGEGQPYQTTSINIPSIVNPRRTP